MATRGPWSSRVAARGWLADRQSAICGSRKETCLAVSARPPIHQRTSHNTLSLQDRPPAHSPVGRGVGALPSSSGGDPIHSGDSRATSEVLQCAPSTLASSPSPLRRSARPGYSTPAPKTSMRSPKVASPSSTTSPSRMKQRNTG